MFAFMETLELHIRSNIDDEPNKPYQATSEAPPSSGSRHATSRMLQALCTTMGTACLLIIPGVTVACDNMQTSLMYLCSTEYVVHLYD